MQAAFFSDGRQRVLIEGVRPQLEGGYPIKRTIGEPLSVEANLFSDGHDLVAGALRYRKVAAPEASWLELALTPQGGDSFTATLTLPEVGLWEYTIVGWVDAFSSWQHVMHRRVDASQDIKPELLIGAQLLESAAGHAPEEERQVLASAARLLRDEGASMERRLETAFDASLARRASRFVDERLVSRHTKTLEVVVDPLLARCSAWYEMFPRSTGEGKHGTFASAEALLPYVSGMGFEVLYLPPIHPIGHRFRKGKNNAPIAEADDLGSPWAIGAAEGGHKAVHPALGTLADFDRFVKRARSLRLEVALDIALQVSPDHPYVTQHPEWFRHRPDGSIQYAENPPKRYQDVYPFDFECDAWRELWEELKSVFLFWAARGVKVFRVDNPHTKPLSFWSWCLREVKAQHPEVIFLAEAFTRPNMMYALAKLGFSQSYTYFTWRVTKQELTRYMTELTRPEIAEFYRPNFWPNTPDILPEHLQNGNRATFLTRLILAATLSSNYGIYGPVYELMEREPRPGAEEYLNNEKYERREWQRSRPDSLQYVIKRVNEIRKKNPALGAMHGLRFHETDNELLLCYSKRSVDGSNVIIVVVNLDQHHTHAGWVTLDLPHLEGSNNPLQLHDLLSNDRYTWHSSRGYIKLDPDVMPAHIFQVKKLLRSENNFEYYL